MANSSKRFSTNFKVNLKKGFAKDSLIDDACALGAPVLYTILPTVLGLSGWMAMFVGFIVPYGLGKLFNIPSLGHAAIGIAITHLIYSKGGKTVNDLLSKPIWTLGTGTGYDSQVSNTPILQPGTEATMNGLQDVQFINAGNEQLQAYNPEEIAEQAYNIPEEAGTSTIDDFIRVSSPNGTLAGISWDDENDNSGW